MGHATDYVLSIDPGDFSGYVLAEILVVKPYLRIVRWGEVFPHDRQKFLESVEVQLANGEIDYVVCENYKPVGGRKTWHPAALHTIGVVQYLCAKYGVPLAMQWSSDVSDFAPDLVKFFQKKENGGIGIGARDDDAESAGRHLVRWRYVTLGVR